MSKDPSDETDVTPPAAPEDRQPAAEPEERVGYGRPPRHTRFKPGQSGNPRGRPRGARNIRTIVPEVLNRKISVTSGGRRKEVPIREAMILRFVETALQGDKKAITVLMDLDERFRKENDAQEDGENAASDIENMAVIKDFLARYKPDLEEGA